MCDTAVGSAIPPIVANLYMEFLEKTAIDTALAACILLLWKQYADDILESITKIQLDHFTVP